MFPQQSPHPGCPGCQQQQQRQRQQLGLGDVIAAGIKAVFGIKPCDACKQRQELLNRLAPRVYRSR